MIIETQPQPQPQLKFEDIQEQSQKINDAWEDFQRCLKNNPKQIILLQGPAKSGKTTLFNLFQNNQNSQSKNIVQITNYVQQKENFMFIDFQNTDDIKRKLIQEEFILRLIGQYKKKLQILFVLQHPEDDLSERGAQLKYFCNKFFGNRQEQENLQFILILNQYLDDLKEEDLKEHVQIQLTKLLRCSIPNIVLIRKKKFAENKDNIKNQIFNFLQKQHEKLNVNFNCFLLDENLKSSIFNLLYIPLLHDINKTNEEQQKCILSLPYKELENKQKEIQKLKEDVKKEGDNLSYWLQRINIKKDSSLQAFQNVISLTYVLSNLQELFIRSCQNILENCESRRMCFDTSNKPQSSIQQNNVNPYDNERTKKYSASQEVLKQIEQIIKEFDNQAKEYYKTSPAQLSSLLLQLQKAQSEWQNPKKEKNNQINKRT